MNSSNCTRALVATFVCLLNATSASAAETKSSLWSMIQQGGWAMAPLAVCSLALIYLILHCLRETRTSRFGSEESASRIAALCGAGQLEAAQEAATQQQTVLGRVLSNGIRKAITQTRADTEATENEIGESLELEENAVAQWIHYLSVIANVSPMIGLLGTVSGMIGGFQTMSAGGMGRPEMFAGDISEALITTATGLSIGIPAMIAHSYFNNRLNSLMVLTHRRANQVVDSLPRPSPTLSPAAKV